MIQVPHNLIPKSVGVHTTLGETDVLERIVEVQGYVPYVTRDRETLGSGYNNGRGREFVVQDWVFLGWMARG